MVATFLADPSVNRPGSKNISPDAVLVQVITWSKPAEPAGSRLTIGQGREELVGAVPSVEARGSPGNTS